VIILKVPYLEALLSYKCRTILAETSNGLSATAGFLVLAALQ